MAGSGARHAEGAVTASRGVEADDLHALLVGGVVPLGARLGLRRVGQGMSEALVLAGHVEAVGESATLRFDLPPGAGVDLMRLALGLVPGRYRIGRMAIDSREVADLSARLWEPIPCDPDDGWIYMRWEAGAIGPEIDVRGLVHDQAGCVRITVARVPDERADEAAVIRDLLASQQRLQLPLGAAVAALGQRLGELRTEVSRASARSDMRQDEHGLRDEHLHEALVAMQERLERLESAHANTLWRRVCARLRGVR